MPFKENPPLYSVWQSMRGRCLNPNYKQWADYGGRGVTICEEWNDYRRFEADMTPRPPGTSIDRIDNDGPYSRENCRWATRTEQMRNQRQTRTVVIEGKTYVAAELSQLSGLKTDTIVHRANQGRPYTEVIAQTRFNVSPGLAKAVQVRVARQRARTHCKWGHEFTADNTYVDKRGCRSCRACHRAKMRRRTAAKSA